MSVWSEPMDPLEIVGRIGGDNTPTDQELTQANNEIREALDSETTSETPDLEVARALRQALDSVTAEQSSRDAAAEETRTEAQQLREGVFDDETVATDVDSESDSDSEDTEAVAASVPSAQDIISRLRASADRRAPADEQPVNLPGVDVRAIGPASGFQIDNSAGFTELGDLFSTHAKSVTGVGNGQPLFRMRRHYDDARTLGSNTDQNNRKLSALLGPDNTPVAASGGLCGPGDVDHTHPILGDTGRPVKDALVQFNATRGKVSYAPTATLADLDSDAIGVWDVDTDASPGNNTKACPHVDCPEDSSCEIQAVHKCLTVGNFQAQFSPELWASRLQLLMVAFDRYAEQLAIEQIDNLASTVTGTVDEGNTLLNFLTAINDRVSYDRSVNRNTNGQYTVIADAWLRDRIRNQVAVGLGVANNVNVLQAADSQINGWLSQVGVTPVWTYDGTLDGSDHRVMDSSTESFDDASLYVFPSDAFVFLDGGTLDLGTEITDSSLNATNDRQAFAESFEKTCLRGPDAYKLDIAVGTQCGCDTGAAAGN